MDETAARWPIGELARRVAAALAVGYDGPGNARVRGVPDVRSIRWYATIGLLDKPTAFRGRTALYGPRHLRQVVAVKRRQAAGATLAQIQVELAGAPDERLASLAKVPPDLLDGALNSTKSTQPGVSAASGIDDPAGDPAEADGVVDGGGRGVGGGSAGSGDDEFAGDSARSDGPAAASAFVESRRGPSPGRAGGRVTADGGGRAAAGDDVEAGGGVVSGAESGEPGEPGGEGPGADAAFWRSRPVTVSVTNGRRSRQRSGPELSYGVRLADGVTILIDAPHTPTEADLEAVRAAAQPLLRVVTARGLNNTVDTGAKP
ncbi:MAG: MerR family transcriptional regulator [Stackebrandtia sp.]